ncbi:hypothetical protein M406DRAFT_349375 [Cryphonectria parasitica EP155]|uniref:Uncharacterized protein n=1 Tax=Cryphonectria parasitica (strain ATCC 38755 / EP155) TaxID=660469 RepID=A0A9P5CTL1_CRYP1|nr:uncharacterized protein M406DRAFT_349375 [Cryphonectria parasitica EP155]KAF3770749.1 hypothetical protein M406DRAFT_349375 [Cryphonectria parasitica EP155]
MVSAVQSPVRQVLFRQSILPLFLAAVYLAILIIPWVLTCVISRNPRFLVQERVHFDIDSDSFLWVNYSTLRLINALNAITAALSLPLLSILLARAAVVSSQRHGAKQRLTVRQLFALADRGWWNPFKALRRSRSSRLQLFGSILLAVALALPIVRSVLLSYHSTAIKLKTDDDYECTCGIDYNPYDLSQSALSNYWEPGDSYDEPGAYGEYTTNGTALMFATTVQAGSSTGFVPDQYVLALKSGAICSSVSSDEVTSQCATAGSSANSGWETSLYVEGYLQANVCVPIVNAGGTWQSTVGADGKPYTFTEDVYISHLILDEESSTDWYCEGGDCLGTESGLYVHCQMNTTLGYVQLGSISSEGVPSRFLNSTPPSFQIPKGTVSGGATGPLMSTAQALFGNGSWFNMLGEMQSANLDNQTIANLVTLACEIMPLNNAAYFRGDSAGCSEIQSYLDWLADSPGGLSQGIETLTYDFFSIFDSPWTARAALNTGAFFANSDLLSAAINDNNIYYDYSNMSYGVYKYDGVQTPSTIPVVTLGALIAITTLIGLQVIAIALLLAYIYSTKVWTTTLNAFAMARIGAQLSRHAAFDWAEYSPEILGIGVVRDDRLAELWEMDGLIDTSVVLESPPERPAAGRGGGDMEMAEFLPAYSPRGHESGEEGEQSSRLVGSEDLARPSSAGSSPPYGLRDEHREGDEVSEMSEDIERAGVEGAVTPASSTAPALAAAAR